MKVKPYEYEDEIRYLVDYEVGDKVWCALPTTNCMGEKGAVLELWDVTDVSPGPRGFFVKIDAFRTGLWVGVDGKPDDARYEKYGWCPEGGWPGGGHVRLWSVRAAEWQGGEKGLVQLGHVLVQAESETAARERGLNQMPLVTTQHRDKAFAAYERTEVHVREVPRHR